MTRLPFLGRLRPYTEVGIRRIPCPRCGRPSRRQWQVCANGRRFATLCLRCDVALNAMVLRFMRAPGADRLMEAYRAENAEELAEERAEWRR